MSSPIRTGILGMGGFAATHHQAVMTLEERGQARLTCTCDPNPDAFQTEQRAWHFARRGVRVFSHHGPLLEACRDQLDLLVVPTPIPLHAEMHRAGIAAGLAVYLEKPPTLDHIELEEMIAQDQRAKKATFVGFNFIIEKPRLALKIRLLAGEFGRLREVHLTGRWPRPTSYFTRNRWAGRLVGDDGRIILDSCLGNAMAHFVHNVLFWAGSGSLMSWAGLEGVQAELYRAHAIEGADTFFVQATTPERVQLKIAISHACLDSITPAETVVCERAVLRYAVGQAAEVQWQDGRVERLGLPPFDTLVDNHLEYYRYLRGEIDRPATTLVDSRAFVALNDLAYVSSQKIVTLAADQVRSQRNEQDQKNYFVINNLANTQDAFIHQGIWPSEAGWKRDAPARLVGPSELAQFRSVVHAMAAPGAEPKPGA